MPVWFRALLITFSATFVVAAVVVARHTDPSEIVAVGLPRPAVNSSVGPPADTAPDMPLVVSDTWINSGPLDATALAGKVVLVDFWTFGCINCKHTLPAVKAWHARYAADGLVVLAVHRPEFDYERDIDAVRDFANKNALTYPIAIDNDSVNWKAYDNHWWPAFYLFDRTAHRQLRHIGEGSTTELEDAIRSLLGVAPDAPRAVITS